MIYGIYSIIVLTWLSLLSAPFLPVGITTLSAAFLPLNFGYHYIFQESISEKGLTALTLPVLFAAPFVFTFSYGRQMFSLSRAGYIPSPLRYLLPYTGQPVVSIWFGVVFCTVVQVICYFAANVTFNVIFYACVIPALLNYVIICIGFVRFRHYIPIYPGAKWWSLFVPESKRGKKPDEESTSKYNTETGTTYVSPVGVYGAVVVVLIALLSLACSFWAITEFSYSLLICGPFVIACTAYYLIYARNHLVMCKEERECVRLVLVKANGQRRDTHTGGSTGAFIDKMKQLFH